LPVNPSSFVPNLFLFCFLSFLPVHQNHKLNVYSEMNKNGNPNSVELLRERERKRESYYISIANIAKSFFRLWRRAHLALAMIQTVHIHFE
jgi:hypothetical protein